MTSEFTIAVHALVFLSHKGTYYSSEGLADNVCTNAARIRKVMAKLKKADLIKTKEGADGGYFFHREAREVDLQMIADALDTPFEMCIRDRDNTKLERMEIKVYNGQ